MNYKIKISRESKKFLKKLPAPTQKRILKKIIPLEKNPYPSESKQLKGEDTLYRIRIGQFRVIYSVESHILTISIIKIAHRKDVYK